MLLKNIKNILKNQHCPNVHIFVLQFRSCCSPNRNPVLETQLTGFVSFPCLLQQQINIGRNMFNCLFSLPFNLTKTVVLICSEYVDTDSQRYCYKNMLRNNAANLHKRVPAGVFSDKYNACSFHYTTDCTALFSLT